MCQVKWYEVLAYRLRCPNGGGGGRPRPFIIIVIWAGFILAENRGSTVSYKGSSQQWHYYYAFMLGSLSCLPMMSRRVFLPLRKGIFCVQRMGWNSTARTIAVRSYITKTTAACEGKGGPKLGVHTSLNRTRIGCVCLLAATVMVGKDGVFVVIRGV